MPLNLKKYYDTVNYLYGLRKYGIKLGLENSRRLMETLREPHKSFRSIHVGGTNGKGSTSAIIASILEECGFRVGLYSSPHLVSFTERIRINKRTISESDVVALTSYIRKVIANTNLTPTFFEFVTAMAFYYFSCEKVDWAVVEVGMGGRLDATNVLLPEISVITNIGLEHTEFLGKTISEIAYEKAGIIKPFVPVVAAKSHPDVLNILKKTAKDKNSELYLYEQDFKGKLISMDDKGIVFNYTSNNRSMTHCSLPTPGKHQVYNASLAIKVCEILLSRGLFPSEEVIDSGLSNSIIEGRLEWLSHAPPIIIDGAHNPEAVTALTDTIKEIFPAKKIITIVGIMKDKDTKGILKPLIRISKSLILTKPKGERSAPPETLKEDIRILQEMDNRAPVPGLISATNTLAEAIELAKKLWRNNSIILITGSFYTTGEAKEILGHTGVLSQLRE